MDTLEVITLEEFRRRYAKSYKLAGSDPDWEARLLQQIALFGLPLPEREYRFHPVREWRLDFAWQRGGRRVACEVDGGVWSGGRHVRGKGFENDLEKMNEAALLGWLVVRVTPTMIEDGRALGWLERALVDWPEE